MGEEAGALAALLSIERALWKASAVAWLLA